MASTGTLLRVEIVKLLRRPMTWILALIYAAILGMLYLTYIVLLASGDIEGMNKQDLKDLIYLPDGLAFGVSLATSVGTMVLIILAAGSFGSEFNWGTIRTMLLMRADRTRLFIAKFSVVLALGLLTIVVGTAGSVAGAVIAGMAGGGGPATSEWLTSAFVQDALLYALRAWVSLAIWALIAASVAILTHSLGVSIGITLAAYLIGDILTSLLAAAGRAGEYASRLFPNTGINALLALNSSDAPTYVTTDYLWITANLLIYTTLFAALALTRFRTMNIMAATSAG